MVAAFSLPLVTVIDYAAARFHLPHRLSIDATSSLMPGFITGWRSSITA